MKTAVLILSALCAAAGSASAAAVVTPHRAIYDLTLLRAEEGASLQSASGKLAFEIQGSSCEGYTVSFRMATKYSPKEGNMTVIDTQTTTYEGPGALEFHHQLKETVNGETRQDLRVNLARPGAGKEGTGEVSTKSGESFTIPPDTALPMQHQLKLMALGATGGGRDSSLVFDGSDEGKVFRAISFVGAEKQPDGIAADAQNPAADKLKQTDAWPMTVSYYDVKGDADTPEYQVSFNMYENGVATQLVLDYGTFVLAGKLSRLDLYQPSACP